MLTLVGVGAASFLEHPHPWLRGAIAGTDQGFRMCGTRALGVEPRETRTPSSGAPSLAQKWDLACVALMIWALNPERPAPQVPHATG